MEREREREKESERDCFRILYTGYLLSIVKIKWEREREQQIINKIEIDTHLLVKWNEQIKLGRLRPKQHEKKQLKKYQSPKEKLQPPNPRTLRDMQMQI